jgi:hypothetical protein
MDEQISLGVKKTARQILYPIVSFVYHNRFLEDGGSGERKEDWGVGKNFSRRCHLVWAGLIEKGRLTPPPSLSQIWESTAFKGGVKPVSGW